MNVPAITYHRFNTEPDVLRHPRAGSETDRTRRAFLLLIITLLIPGGAQIGFGSRRLGRAALAVTVACWFTLLLGVVMYLFLRGPLLSALTQPFVMWVGAVVLAALALGWLLLWLDALRLVHLASLAPGMRPVIAVTAVVLMVLTSGGLGYAAKMLNDGRTALSGIFGGGPAIDADEDGRYNFLLMGADAGEGREGLRPDSIHVVSVSQSTGESIIVSIPRNFQNAQFSEDSPLREVYPNGYDCGNECIINFLYTDVMNDYQHLYPDAEDPGAEAMLDAVSGTLNLQVDGYVMVDMGGFEQLIDAMGGVSVQSGGWVPYRGVRPDGEWGDAWWGPDDYTFSGEEALAYARSRAFSSDYNRIQRQQCIQQAMIAQFNPQTLLTQFGDIMQAGENLVETNLPQSQLGSLLDLAVDAQGHQPQRLTLGAPDFGSAGDLFSTYPDFDEIHQRMEQLKQQEEGSEGGVFGAGENAEGQAGIAPFGTVLLDTALLDTRVALATELQSQDAVEEDEPPIEETPPPTQSDGSPLTEEYLMEAQDAGQVGVLEEAASTNYECTPQ